MMIDTSCPVFANSVASSETTLSAPPPANPAALAAVVHDLLVRRQQRVARTLGLPYLQQEPTLQVTGPPGAQEGSCTPGG